MADKKNDSFKFEELRNKAEKLLQDRGEFDSSDYPSDLFGLMEELRVHQAELEVQNEELKSAQKETSKLRQEYEVLYEYAPCGYLILSPKGIITLCNLKGAALLGVERGNLKSITLSRFVTRDSQNRYFRAFREAKPSWEQQNTELELARQDGETVWVQANIYPEQNKEGSIEQWRITLTDITQRKRAEEAIESERAYLSAVIDNIGEAIVICNAEGRIARFNETARRLHGLPEEPIPADKWAEHFDLYQEDGITPLPIEDIPLFRVLQGELVQNAEIVVAPRHSRPYNLVCSGQALTDQTGKITGAVVAMHDITERKRMEQSLRRERDISQRYLDTTQTMMVALDAEGQITMINRSGRELLGYAEDEILGCNWFETCLPHPEGMDSVYPVFQTIMAGELDSVEYFENNVVCRDGTQRQMGWHNAFLEDDAGRVVGLLASGEDITARKQTEEALRKSEERYKKLINTSPDAIALVDEHGRFLTANPVMAQRFNLTQDDLEGKTYYDVMPQDLADKRITDAKKSLNYKEPVCIEDERQDRYLQNYYVPLSTSDSPRTFQTISRDITEHKLAKKQLQESEERFRQWFESSPISLWEQDFSDIKRRIDEIKAQNVGDLDSYLRQRPELLWELAGMVRVLDVNQATLNLYRANSKEDFWGGITKIFSRESLEGFLQVLEVIAAGENTFVTEKEHVTLDGEPLKIQLYWTVAKGHEETYSRILVSIVDITDRKEAEERLQAAHNKLDTLVQLNADGLMVLDQEGSILFLNPAAAEMLGREQDELLGAQFGHPLIPGSNTEIELLSNSEEARVVELRGRETEWSGQTALLASFRDMTERKQAEERIYKLAYYDDLTGLPNRRLFYDRLKQVSARSEHFGEGGAVFLVDITRLREVNDTLGQQAGDELIVEVARRIGHTLGEEDTVARVSGGEFIVLSEGKSTTDRARDLRERILKRIGWNLELSGRLIYPEVNIGFTLFPDWGTDPDTLIKQADLALSEAKKSTHRIQGFAGQEDWISRLFHLEHDLKKAMEKEEFFLCYQSQIDLRTGRIVGLEALLRWEHPERGVVSPGEFIPVLEQTGLIASADAWVIHRVCEQLRSWQESGVLVKASVNLSAQELSNDATIEVFRAALEENGVRAENLEVEITETALMENVDQASRILQTLSSWGVRVALDDFGKGYSSLSYLQQLAINTIKIDKQFVDGLPENKDSVTLVQTIIAMAHNLGKGVLAEGVESEEQRQTLLELGCDYGQGFLWSRPQPVENLIIMGS